MHCRWLSFSLALVGAAASSLGAKAPLTPLLADLSKRACAYFWEQSNPVTGLSKDRANNFGPDGYNVASIASTGYSLAAYAVAYKRGYYTPAATLARAQNTLAFLDGPNAAKFHGWYYHFIDWSTGQRVWNSEVSDIDTSILISGMLVAKAAFNDPTVTARVNHIISQIDWQWFLTDGGAKPSQVFFNLGWTPENGFLPYRWSFMNEEAMLYIQALGAWPSMPNASWGAINRPIVSYGGLQTIFAGPLFQHQMSEQFLDYAGKRDSLGFDYYIKARNAALEDRQYCIDNPSHYAGYGANFWGLSACDVPTGYGAQGAPNYFGISDNGTVSPMAALSSLGFTPVESINAANYIKANYPGVYGRYGFVDSLNPTSKWTDTDTIGIDVGMLLLSIENYRDNLIHNLAMSDPILQVGMARAGFRVTSEGPINSRSLQVGP